MQAVTIRQLRANPSNALAAAREDDLVIVMNRDTPQAVLVDLKQLGGPDLPAVRVALAVSLFRNGSVSVGFAARMAGKPLAEMLTLLSSMGIPLTGDGEIAAGEALGEMRQMRGWLEKIRLGEGQSRLIRFDETPVPHATLADLDETLWQRFIPFRSGDTREVLLGKLAMAAQDEQGAWRPTVAGLLMGSRVARRFMPEAFIQAVAYRGTDVLPTDDSVYQQDAQDIIGPLDRQILDACAFVRKNMRVAARKHPEGGREDLPQFDMLAVFEAIANAVAHRDYSMAGTKVRLRLFDDRLEIYSPGMLPNTMTPESLPFRQSARNEALTSLLARCPIDDDTLAVYRRNIMDKRGEGVPIILETSERLSGKRPEYRLNDESELMLTIYGARVE